MSWWKKLFGSNRGKTDPPRTDHAEAILQAAHRQLSVNESVALQSLHNRFSHMLRDSQSGWYKEESFKRGLGTIYYYFQMCERVDFQVQHGSNMFYVRLFGFIIRQDQQTGHMLCKFYPIVVSSMHQGFNIIDSITYKKPNHHDRTIKLHLLPDKKGPKHSEKQLTEIYDQLKSSKEVEGQYNIVSNCNILNLHHCNFSRKEKLFEELDKLSRIWTLSHFWHAAIIPERPN